MCASIRSSNHTYKVTTYNLMHMTSETCSTDARDKITIHLTIQLIVRPRNQKIVQRVKHIIEDFSNVMSGWSSEQNHNSRQHVPTVILKARWSWFPCIGSKCQDVLPPQQASNIDLRTPESLLRAFKVWSGRLKEPLPEWFEARVTKRAHKRLSDTNIA